MRSKVIVSLAFGLLLWAAAWAEGDDPLLAAMREELARTTAQLHAGSLEKPYFVQYVVEDNTIYHADAADGGLTSSDQYRTRPFAVDVRVGDYQLDNSGGRSDWSAGNNMAVNSLVLDNQVTALRHDLWLATDTAYRRALEALAYKRSLPNEIDKEHVADLSREKAVVSLAPIRKLEVEPRRCEQLVRALSVLEREFPSVLSLQVSLRAEAVNRYLVNSEGTQVRKPTSMAVLQASADAQDPDGGSISHSVAFAAADVASLPKESDMAAAVRQMLAELVALSKAPTLEEEYIGPVLLTGHAAAEVFAEVLVPLCCRVAAGKGKLRKPILPVWVSVTDDPRLSVAGGQPLLGGYQVDDEGVAAQAVRIVDQGVFNGLLGGREPSKQVPQSNGHGRGGVSSTRAFVSNFVVSTSRSKSFDELKRELLERCRQQGLPYGIIGRVRNAPCVASVRGLPPVLYYKVDVKSGHEDLVRGVVRENVDLRVLKRMTALGKEAAVCHYVLADGLCVSVVAPSLLLGELQLTPANPTKGDKPVLPRPSASR